MRGKDEQQLDVFSYISPEQRVPHDHPLYRARFKGEANSVLASSPKGAEERLRSGRAKSRGITREISDLDKLLIRSLGGESTR